VNKKTGFAAGRGSDASVVRGRPRLLDFGWLLDSIVGRRRLVGSIVCRIGPVTLLEFFPGERLIYVMAHDNYQQGI
jgi:hypothetical protein